MTMSSALRDSVIRLECCFVAGSKPLDLQLSPSRLVLLPHGRRILAVRFLGEFVEW